MVALIFSLKITREAIMEDARLPQILRAAPARKMPCGPAALPMPCGGEDARRPGFQQEEEEAEDFNNPSIAVMLSQ